MANVEDHAKQLPSLPPPYYIPATVLRPPPSTRDRQTCHKRLRRESLDLAFDPPPTISAGPNSLADPQSWTAMLMIPADRAPPYAGGIFALDVRFPDEYPRAPPEIKFATQIWHPNVNDATGEICGLRVLEERNWSPVVLLRHVLLDLETLMESRTWRRLRRRVRLWRMWRIGPRTREWRVNEQGGLRWSGVGTEVMDTEKKRMFSAERSEGRTWRVWSEMEETVHFDFAVLWQIMH